jgi:hypothetical protein
MAEQSFPESWYSVQTVVVSQRGESNSTASEVIRQCFGR